MQELLKIESKAVWPLDFYVENIETFRQQQLSSTYKLSPIHPWWEESGCALKKDEDGTLRTLEVDLDFSSNDQSKLPSNTVIDKELEKFASLQDQIHVKYNDYENYGDKIVKIAS